MKSFFYLIGVLFTATAAPVRCADKMGLSSGTVHCSYATTQLCGLTDVCCKSGCAPVYASCADDIGYCEPNQTPSCDATGCCCVNDFERSCSDKSMQCSNTENIVNRTAAIAGGIVGGLCLLCCCAGIYVAWKNNHRHRSSHCHTQLDCGSYAPPQHGQAPVVYHAQPPYGNPQDTSYGMPVYQQQQFPVAMDGRAAVAPPPHETSPPVYYASPPQ